MYIPRRSGRDLFFLKFHKILFFFFFFFFWGGEGGVLILNQIKGNNTDIREA